MLNQQTAELAEEIQQLEHQAHQVAEKTLIWLTQTATRDTIRKTWSSSTEENTEKATINRRRCPTTTRC